MGAYILVTVLAGILLGMMLCIGGVFCWYMLKMIKDLKAAVDLQAKATHELIGEGSFTRISKSLATISGNMPDILAGVKEFASTLGKIVRASEDAEEPARHGRTAKGAAVSDQESGFYRGVTDQQAAVDEVQAEMDRQTIPFTREEAARAHTDEAT